MLTIKQWFCLLKYRISSLLKYPIDVVLGIVGTMLWHMPNFILLTVVFDNDVRINFSKGYLILLYGLSVFGDGMQHTFTEALWQFGNTFIKSARFDEILTKPASDFVQIITSRFDIDGLGGVLWGAFCCFYGYGLIEDMTFWGVIKICIAMMCVTCFFIGINVITSAFAFLIYDNFYITHTIFELHKFARFPRQIYPRRLGMFLTFVIPVFAATFCPANILISNSFIALLGFLMVGICFLFFSVKIWNLFSKFYISAGS